MKLEHNNYYELLELSSQAGQDEIHESYVRSKNAYSGESVALYSLLSERECQEILEQVEQAYSILSDPSKRREYDKAKNIKNNTSNSSDQSFQHQQPPPTLQRPSGPEYSKNEQFSKDFTINQNEVEISRITAHNRFRLEFASNPEFEQEIENETNFDGAFLKKIREYKNVSIDRMSDLTKISRSYIRHIENNDLANLPAMAYIRGFVYQYAKCLKLMPDLVATSYLNQLKANSKEKEKGKAGTKGPYK